MVESTVHVSHSRAGPGARLELVPEFREDRTQGATLTQRVLAGLLMAVLAPVMGVLAVVTRATVGSPITVDAETGRRFRTDPSPWAGRRTHSVVIQMRRWNLDQLPMLWWIVRGVAPRGIDEPRWPSPVAIDGSAR